MKKLGSFIKLLIVVIISAVIVFLANKALSPLARNESENSELTSVYSEATSFNELNDINQETINKVYEASDGSNVLGYVFDATTVGGYGGPINFLIGISNDGVIKGFEVKNHNETEGFGAVISDDSFKENVLDVNVSNGVSYGEKDIDNGQIEAISGATVTTDAITSELVNIVNELSQYSDNVAHIHEDIPYYVGDYEKLIPQEISNLKFEELELREDDPEVYNNGLKRIIKVSNEDDSLNSYILQANANGYAGDIDMLIRVNDEYRVFDISYPYQNETPDYGGYIEDDVYKDSIKGVNLKKNFLTKAMKVKENPKGEKDILLISGATVTSLAMKDGLDEVISGLVEFDKIKNDANFTELDIESLLSEINSEDGPKYDHKSLFENVDDSKLLDVDTEDTVVSVANAYSGGDNTGKIIDIISEGFAGDIEFGILVSNEGIIEDFVVYNHTETEGYGSEIEDKSFRDKVVGLDLENSEKFESGKDIDLISGATYTSDAILKGLNSAIKAYNDSLDASEKTSSGEEEKSGGITIEDGSKETSKLYKATADGFAGDIEYGIDIDENGEILDFEVYNHSETEGYGADIESKSYKEKLIGKNISEIDSVDGISGATVTSDAMKNSFNEVLNEFNGSN